MLLSSFDKVATPLRKDTGSAAGTPAATMITPSSAKGRALEWHPDSRGGGSGGYSIGHRSVSFTDDALLSPTSSERDIAASSSAQKKLFAVSPEHRDDYGQLSGEACEPSVEFATTTVRKDARSLVLLAQYKLSLARMSLELALGKAKDIASEADEPMTGLSPRQDVPVAHNISDELNLRLVADLILTPGKTLTLSPN